MVLPQAELLTHLRSVLPRASPDSIEVIGRAARVHAFTAGEALALEPNGSDWTSLLVLAGQAAVAQSSDDGRQAIVLVATPDRMLAVPPSSHIPAPLELIGLTEGVVAAWHGTSVTDRVAHDTGLAADLVVHLLGSVAALLHRVEVMTFDSALMRLAQTFLEHGDLALDPQQPMLTRPQLAAVLGTSREMTSRVLTQLEAAGAIERVGRSGIVLMDRAQVRRVAGREPG